MEYILKKNKNPNKQTKQTIYMPSGIQQSQILFVKTKFKLFTQKQWSSNLIFFNHFTQSKFRAHVSITYRAT